MTIIEAVRQFLQSCPLLTDDRLNVDFLPAEAATYSVDVVPTTPIVRRYLDRSSIRQFSFVLATRAFYGQLIRQQLDNLAFFEAFTEWLEAQDAAKNFPDLGPNRQALQMEVVASGYAFAAGTENARYQIQLKLTYHQKGARK